MITTPSAGAVENRSYLDGTAVQWPHSSAESSHEAWRLGEIESTRSRTTNRQRPRPRCRDRRLGCRSAAPRSDRFGIGRLPLRRGSRRRRHPGRRRGRDPSRFSDRRLASRRPRRPAGRAARQQLPAPHRRLSLSPLQRSRRHDRPGAARLAADAGYAVRRRLLLRSDHRHQRPLDRLVVLPRRGLDRGESHRAQPPGQELASCRPSGRARRRHRLRPHGPAAAARLEFRLGWPAHPGRLRR